MTAATLLAEIVQADGEIWAEDDRLKFRGVPARLVPAIREHKAALLALLDTYAGEERAGIMEFDGELPRAEAERLAGIAPIGDYPTPAASVRPERDMAPQSAPASVTCGSCARYQPGSSAEALGRCLAALDGLPPRGGSGYGAPFPNAPRRCPEFRGIGT